MGKKWSPFPNKKLVACSKKMKILKCPFNWVINPNHSVSQTECSVTMCTCYLAVLYLHDWQRRWLTVVCNKCEDFIQIIFFFKDMIHMGGDNRRNRGKIPPTKISRQKEISARWSKSCFVKMPRKRKSHSEITKIKLSLVCVNFKLAWLNLVMLEEICKICSAMKTSMSFSVVSF